MNREPLEVVYADEEKAICLRLISDKQGGWSYTESCIAISNKDKHYENQDWLKKASNLKITGSYRWKPIEVKYSYNI